MMTRLTMYSTGLAALLASGLSGCVTPPDYPETPEIEFNRLTLDTRTNSLGQQYTNAAIVVNYKDGDGDLGLRNTDTAPPYNEINADGTLNPNYYNYLCTLQVRNANNQFVDYVFPPSEPAGYNGRYPYLVPAEQGDRKAPLRGELSLDVNVSSLSFASPPITSGAVIRFKVRIKDRALHLSNEVTTSVVTLP